MAIEERAIERVECCSCRWNKGKGQYMCIHRGFPKSARKGYWLSTKDRTLYLATHQKCAGKNTIKRSAYFKRAFHHHLFRSLGKTSDLCNDSIGHSSISSIVGSPFCTCVYQRRDRCCDLRDPFRWRIRRDKHFRRACGDRNYPDWHGTCLPAGSHDW